MCGIIAVVRRKTTRTPPSPDEILGRLQPLPDLLAAELRDAALEELLHRTAAALDEVNVLLGGVAGVQALLFSPDVRAAVSAHCDGVAAGFAGIDGGPDRGRLMLDGDRLERVNAAMVRAKDLQWAIAEDRVRTAEAVADLLNGTGGAAAIEAFTSVQIALRALDRLEVRGRDSAGVHLLVRGHGLDLDATGTRALLHERTSDPLFR